MRRSLLASAAALAFVLPVVAISQSSNGRISSPVADATGALIPGADMTATKTATGVTSTTVSNQSSYK